MKQGWVIALCALVLTGCFNSHSTQTKATSKPQALTWHEYVKRELPKHQAAARKDVPYQRRHFPNMSRWRPSDFLTPKQLHAKHKYLCDLPKKKRKPYLEAIQAMRKNVAISPDSPQVKMIRHYAQQHYYRAQLAFAGACYKDGAYGFKDGAYGVSSDQALNILKMAANTGLDAPSAEIGWCLDQQLYGPYSDTGASSRSFKTDEMLYWLWRAAQHLDTDALGLLGNYPTASDFLVYRYDLRHPQVDPAEIETYKWYELDDLATAEIGAVPTSADLTKIYKGVGWADGVAQSWKMTKNQVIAARQATKAWLLKYPKAFKNDDPNRDCELKMGYPPPTQDVRLLNKYLQAVGLRFDSKTQMVTDIGPVQPPAWLQSDTHSVKKPHKD